MCGIRHPYSIKYNFKSTYYRQHFIIAKRSAHYQHNLVFKNKVPPAPVTGIEWNKKVLRIENSPRTGSRRVQHLSIQETTSREQKGIKLNLEKVVQRWEIITENKKVRKKRKKTRSRPRKRKKKNLSFFLVESVISFFFFLLSCFLL